MKKLLQMKFMLLLCALIVGSGTMWAEEDDAHNFSQTLEQLLNNNATISSIEIAEQSYPVKKVVVSYRYNRTIENAVTVAVSVGGNNWGSQNVVGTGSNYSTLEFAGEATTGAINISFTNNTGNGTGHGTFYVNNVQLVEGGSSLTDSDFALTGAPIALSFDLYNNKEAKLVNFTTSSEGAVTVSGGEGYVTTSVSGNTITVTPTAVTPSAQTITVNQAADNNYKKGSATFTVTITDSTPGFTVTLGDYNTELTEELVGAGVTLPERTTTVTGYTFAGWSETNVSIETTTAPNIIPAGTYYPTDDITLYPVYRKLEGGGKPSAFSVGNTGNYAIVSAEQNGKYYALPTTPTVSNGKITAQEITVSEIDNVKYVTPQNATGFTWTIEAATNGYTLSDGSNYIYHSNGGASGTNLSYGSSTSYTWAFTADGDYITMAGMSSSTTNSRGLLFSGTTIGGYALSNANTSGYYKVMILPISAGSTIYYWSSPVAAAVEKPVITIAENPFLFSTTATITCATEGAAIKYRYDGETWNDYTEALTITETKTIYAKAIKGNDESSVAQVTATKNLAEPTVTVSGDLTLDLDGGTNVSAGTLTAAVTYENAAVGSATVTWSSSDEDIATIDESTGAVILIATGEVTFTATYAGNSDYAEATGTKTVTVIDSKAPGTENNPYTVAEARAAIDAGTGVTEVYATGIVSEIVTAFNSQYGNITYNISADGLTTSDQLQAYRGKSYNGDAFTSADDIQVGDVVVIYGNLTKYGSTYEFGEGNQLVSLVRKPATPTFDPEEGSYTSVQNVTISTTTTGATIYYTTDGTAPTTESTQYSEAITVDETTTIKAIAVKDSEISDVATAVYVINLSPVITVASPIELDGNTPSKNITISYNNFTPGSDDFGVVYCDENGDELSGGYKWIEKITQWIDETPNTATMRFMFDPNTGSAPRTAYMKIYAMNGNDRVYSELITITQEVYVEPIKVSFYVNGGPIEYSYLKEGDPIVFPKVDDKDGMTFLGWTSNEINGTTDTAPEFVDVTSAKMGTESIDYYAVFALLVAPGTTSTVIDELTKALTGASGSSYSSWEGKKASSDAVYKGNSAGGYDAIQLRSNNNSGIVTTTSGGKLKKVTVEWNGNTANDRTLDIYGKNTAYSAASNLYGANTQGTKIGSIVCGTSTELTISGDYTFIGLRSNSGAMYLDKITIEWETGTPDTYSDYCTTIPAMLTVTIAEACTDGSKYYGTFSSSSAFKVPANVTVSEIGINNGGTMNVQEYAGGAIVPANTGVMVSATTFGEHKLIISSEEGKSVLGAENRLRPTGDNGLTATEMNSAEPETCKFYRLTMHNSTQIGFWWGADGGQSFDIAANKAYLAVPASVAGARNGFAFGDDATGISNVNVNENVNGSVFDLQGRKVSTPGKGLYIVNGKKVVIK